MPETQNYQNHVRWFPLVHFVIFPMFTINLLWAGVRLYQEPSWDRVEFLFLAIALALMALAARAQALKAQDRIIRLEERLRYKDILSAEMAGRAHDLPVGQMIALRFAADAELPALIEKTLNGEFAKPKDIKLAINEWQGDHLRV